MNSKALPTMALVAAAIVVPLLLQTVFVARGESLRNGSMTSNEVLLTLGIGYVFILLAYRRRILGLLIATVAYVPMMLVASGLWIHDLLVVFYGGP